MGLTELKSRYHQGCVLWETLGENCSFPFHPSKGCLYSFNGGLFLFKASNGQSSLFCAHCSDFVSLITAPLTLTPLPPSSTYEDTAITLGPLDNPGWCAHLHILNLITPSESLLPCETIYSQIPRLRCGYSVGREGILLTTYLMGS